MNRGNLLKDESGGEGSSAVEVRSKGTLRTGGEYSTIEGIIRNEVWVGAQRGHDYFCQGPRRLERTRTRDRHLWECRKVIQLHYQCQFQYQYQWQYQYDTHSTVNPSDRAFFLRSRRVRMTIGILRARPPPDEVCRAVVVNLGSSPDRCPPFIKIPIDILILRKRQHHVC